MSAFASNPQHLSDGYFYHRLQHTSVRLPIALDLNQIDLPNWQQAGARYLPQLQKYSVQALVLATVLALHWGLPALWATPAAPVIAAKVPPMTVQLVRSQPVQPAPVQRAAVQPEPKPAPVKLKPAPVKPQPRPLAKPVQQVQPVKPIEPVALPVTTPSAATPPAETASAEPVLVPQAVAETAATADPAYLQNPAPVYPDFAIEQGWEGAVLLHVQVRPDGSPADVQVKTSSGRRLLDNAAVSTVAGWRFEPATRGGQPIESWVDVPIEFSLSQG